MNFLVLSTLPHYLAILPLIKNYNNYKRYIQVIFFSSSMSILYHSYNGVDPMISFADYLMAFVWSMCDIYLGYRAGRIYLARAIYLNILILLLNLLAETANNYELAHSCWHILSASKCYFISYSLSLVYAKPPVVSEPSMV